MLASDEIDARFNSAIRSFWSARNRQFKMQEERGKLDAGSRGAVTGGTQLGALEFLMRDILVVAGLDAAAIKTRSAIELPGYYRPEKKWDLLVISNNQLVAAIELKSHVGPSFGNNFNNRTEEAIGSAADLWLAYRERRLGNGPTPFLGYFMILEDCPEVHSPVKAQQKNFPIDPVFTSASYSQRYAIFCERLLLERQYEAACLTLSGRPPNHTVSHPNDMLSFRRFAVQLEGAAVRFMRS